MEVKFGLLEKVFFFNTAECKISSDIVKKIQVVPTGVSKDESGNDRLDGFIVLYETVNGPVLAEQECYASEGECFEAYRQFFWPKEK